MMTTAQSIARQVLHWLDADDSQRQAHRFTGRGRQPKGSAVAPLAGDRPKLYVTDPIAARQLAEQIIASDNTTHTAVLLWQLGGYANVAPIGAAAIASRSRGSPQSRAVAFFEAQKSKGQVDERALILEIEKRFDCSRATVYRWLQGRLSGKPGRKSSR